MGNLKQNLSFSEMSTKLTLTDIGWNVDTPRASPKVKMIVKKDSLVRKGNLHPMARALQDVIWSRVREKPRQNMNSAMEGATRLKPLWKLGKVLGRSIYRYVYRGAAQSVSGRKFIFQL